MSALTLYEASKVNAGDVKKSAVIEMFPRASELLAAMPFQSIDGGSLSYTLEGTLPGVAFRGYNEGYTASTGVLNPQTEVLRIAGGELDVDTAIIATRGEGTRESQEAMKIKSLALYLTSKFINGDSVADPREFDGLRTRIGGSQLFEAGGDNAYDSGYAATAIQALSVGSALDRAIDAVDDPTHLIMSKDMRRLLSRAVKSTSVSGNIEWDKDDLGKRIAYYNDIPIITTDMDDTGAKIIGFNEASPNAGSTAASSMYVVNFGPNMVTGIQNDFMDVRDLGEIDASPVMRTRLEWLIGLAVQHGRSCSRIWGIANSLPVV